MISFPFDMPFALNVFEVVPKMRTGGTFDRLRVVDMQTGDLINLLCSPSQCLVKVHSLI